MHRKILIVGTVLYKRQIIYRTFELYFSNPEKRVLYKFF